MKKEMFRISSAVTAFLLMTACFAGCSNKADENSAVNNNIETTSTANVSTTSISDVSETTITTSNTENTSISDVSETTITTSNTENTSINVSDTNIPDTDNTVTSMADNKADIISADNIEEKQNEIEKDQQENIEISPNGNLVIDYSDIIYDGSVPEFSNEVDEDVNPYAEGIDPAISAALGFDVPYLYGTAQEKADQLAAILTEHYSYMGLTFSSGGEGVACSNWPDFDWNITSEEEAISKCYEVLGEGHSLTGLTVEEAYSVAPWLITANYDEYSRIQNMLSYSFFGTDSGNGEIHVYW